MAKPDIIILLRHGQSEGNQNPDVCAERPDYAYRLTPTGHEQAFRAGEDINGLAGGEPIMFYCSPYWRTRQTLLEVQKSTTTHRVYEDPRLREQEWVTRIKDRVEGMNDERDSYGHFYYRIENGESCADVYDRVSDFLNTLHRDFEKPNYPRTTCIVCHGMTMRVFLMRWFHMTVEEFELLANPTNCGTYVMALHDNDEYYLVTEPKRYPSRNHPYQFDAASSSICNDH